MRRPKVSLQHLWPKALEIGHQQYVVAVQLSIDKINAVMQVREGMGQTGESYLVGPDQRMRSDSYLDSRNRTVRASFAGAVSTHGVDTAAANAALKGQAGLVYIDDYNGNPVVSAFAPVDAFGLQWALLAEVDVAENRSTSSAHVVDWLARNCCGHCCGRIGGETGHWFCVKSVGR